MEQNPDMMMVEITKVITKEWSTITPEKRNELNELAEKEIQRYQNEMDQLETLGYFINAQGEKSIDLMLKNPKFHDDVVLPKKPKTAFLFFSKTEGKLMKQSNPELKMTDISKICGQKWKTLTKEDLIPYQKLSDEDHIRYDNEKRQLLTVGYFIDQQGVKSTDRQLNQKKINTTSTNSLKSDQTGATLSTKSQSKLSMASSSTQKKKVVSTSSKKKAMNEDEVN